MPNERPNLSWRDRLRSLTPKSEFSEPASQISIAHAETALKVEFPAELASLLKESNGVQGEYGLGLLWSVERIEEDNLKFRTFPDFRKLYMPFSALLFFGDAGNGDQFAYTILEGEVRRGDIFVWDHEDDSRIWVAPSLSVFYDWWLTGKVKI
jgi:hypothetical protein